MIFHWDDENRAHMAHHGVSESQAEAAFQAEDATAFPDAARLNRWVLEATVEDRTLKVAFARGLSRRLPDHHRALDEFQTTEDAMTTKKPKRMSMAEFEKASGPGEPLGVLQARQEADAAWAERAFRGEEVLGTPIRIQRGRPRAGDPAASTVVKAIRLPETLLEQLQIRAKVEGLSLNALLQMAAAEYLVRHRGA